MKNRRHDSASNQNRASHSRFKASFLLASLLLLAGPTVADISSPAARAEQIDLSNFKPSFKEDFDSLDVSSWGCLSRWIAHTPWAGDFGNAKFMDPGENSPFSIDGGILTITARRVEGDRWESGMLSSWSRCNGGYAQTYGYFEIRTKLPEGAGFWPAFWLIGVDRSEGAVEVDVFEYYSHRPDKLELTIHRHKASAADEKIMRNKNHYVEPGSLSSDFHTYGAELTEDEVIFYLDRREIWRTAAPTEFRQPMYILVSLATQNYRMNEDTPDRATMEIDYIHAYQRRPIGFSD